MNYINSKVSKIHQEEKMSLIMGDFNIDLLKTNSLSDNFLNSFQPQILQATRITDHSATLIDNIFFNSIEHFVISGNLIYDLTDHLPNFIIINRFGHLPPNVKIYKRDYSKFDKTQLVNEVSRINWETIFTSNNDPSDMLNKFYTKISDIIDKHLPLKKYQEEN